jgi:zeaxanthin glucosyltransferase
MSGDPEGREMARVLIVASHLLGPARSAVELARRLKARGHSVEFAAPEAGRATPEAAGFHARPIPEYPLNPLSLVRPPDYRDAPRSDRIAEGLERLGASVMPELLKSARPDLALLDAELHAHILATLASGRPVGLITTMFPGLPGPASPPMDSLRTPGRGLRNGSAGIWALWLRLWARREWNGLRRRLADPASDVPTLLRAHARALGIDLSRETTRLRYAYPWGYRRLPLLVLQAREMDLPSTSPPNVRYVGPMLEARDDARDLANLDRGSRRPRIYVAFGSLAAPPPAFATRLLEAFARMPEIDVVFVRGRLPEALLERGPPNVRVVDWADQPAELQKADLGIAHAGIGTLTECVEAGRPVLVYPMRRADQMGNAARVRFHGLGRVGSFGDDVERIVLDVRAALEDDGARERVQRMREASRRYAASGADMDEIERLLEEERGR